MKSDFDYYIPQSNKSSSSAVINVPVKISSLSINKIFSNREKLGSLELQQNLNL